MRCRLIWGFVSLFVAACGHPIPVGAGGAGGAGGTGGNGQDASPPPPQCVSVAGQYLHGEVVDVEQTNCDVSAVIPGFGSFTCVAQAPGSVPRMASCIVHVDRCPLHPGFQTAPADDGRTFTFSLWTRHSTCYGNSMGGTLVFTLTLTPFTPAPTPLP